MADSREDIEKKLKALRESLDATDKFLFDRILKGLQNGATSLAEWNAALSLFKTKADQLSDTLDYVGTSLSNSVNELAKGNEFINRQISSSRQLRGISEQLLSMRQGESNYDLKKIKKLEEQAKANYRILDSQLQQLLLEGKTDDKLKEKVESAKLLLDQFDELKKEAKEFEKSLGITGGILKGLSKIPILGDLLGIQEAMEASEKAARNNATRLGTFSAALKSMGSSLKSSLSDPLVVIGLLVKGFQALLELGFKVDKQVVDLQKSLYLSRAGAEGLRENFQFISKNNQVLVDGLKAQLLNVRNQVEATMQLSTAMGAVGLATNEEIQSQIKLTKQMGFSAEEAANLYVLGRQNNMTSAEIVGEVQKQVKSYQKQTGVLLDVKKITQDVSKITGQLRLQYGNNVNQLISATIQANKLGFSLEQTKKIAEGLLDFEQSIENELAAELLINKDLNLEQARLLALNGKSAEATALIAENMGGSAGFAAMNVIQQEALAKALGMNADELANSILYQENLGRLKEEDQQRLKDQLDYLRSIGAEEQAQQLERAVANGTNIQAAMDSLDSQTKFNEAVEKLKDILVDIVDGPAMRLANAISEMLVSGTGLYKILGGIATILTTMSVTKLVLGLIQASVAAGTMAASAAFGMSALTLGGAALVALAGGALIMNGINSAADQAEARAKKPANNFASGGIVGGSSLAGDNMKINANSGEMVLTRRQQANLFKMANGGGGGSGDIHLTANLIMDGKQFALAVASVERKYSNLVGSARQESNSLPQ